MKRLDSPGFGMLLDVGHAHVVAGFTGVDTLTLDLHLPPGGGTVPWPELVAHEAPLMMEIHPAHRSSSSSLWEAAVAALAPSRPTQEVFAPGARHPPRAPLR